MPILKPIVGERITERGREGGREREREHARSRTMSISLEIRTSFWRTVVIAVMNLSYESLLGFLHMAGCSSTISATFGVS